MSGIYQLDAGRPLAVSYTDVSDLDSASTLSRPNVVPGVSDKEPGGSQIKLGGIYFNKAAFTATPTLRVEMFNALNNVTFNGPTTSFTSSTFGEVATLTQSNTPRNVQLSVRLSF